MSILEQKGKHVFRMLRQRGVGVIKALVLIPVMLMLVIALVFAFYEGRKAYFDYRVQEMCEKDGGAKIFEKILLNRDDAKARGLLVGNTLVIPTRSSANQSSIYYIDYESSDVRSKSPRVFRARTTIVRTQDERVIAEMITYSRVGGDFPTFAHPSSAGCNDADSVLTKFRTAVQIKEEMQ